MVCIRLAYPRPSLALSIYSQTYDFSVGKIWVMQRPPHVKLALGLQSLQASARSGNLTLNIVLKCKHCKRHLGSE